MACITAFNFKQGDTFFHQIDIRLKLFSLALFSASGMKCSFYGLILLTVILIVSLIYIKLPFISTVKELYGLIFLLIFVFISRSLSIPGTQVIKFWFISATHEGITSGAIFCWRLLLIILTGLLFTATTKTTRIKSGIQWFLSPIPFVPEKKVAVMISLLTGFIPIILRQAHETTQAQRARGIENRKNPLYRLTKFSIPFICRTFESADKLTLAMEARCYTEQRTEPQFSFKYKDYIALLIVILLMIILNC